MSKNVLFLFLIFVSFGSEHSAQFKGTLKQRRDITPEKNNSSCKRTEFGVRRCETYRRTHCKPILQYYNSSSVSVNCTEDQDKVEEILQSISTTLVTYYGASDECLKGSQWSLCLMSMPPKCSTASVLQGVLCREACLLVKNHLCYEEWRKIESLKQNGILSNDIIIPDCNIYPSMKRSITSQPCLYPKLFADLERQHKAKGKKDVKKSNTLVVASAAGGAGLFLIILIAAIVMCRRGKGKAKQPKGVLLESLPNAEFFDGLTTGSVSNFAYTGDNPLYSKDVALDKINLEKIQREWLRYIEPLAEGAFGKVVKCELVVPNSKTGPQLTAVKYLKDDASEKVKSSFQKEAETLGSIDHPNIVRLLGICTDNLGPQCMVLEFMKLGDLTQYLRERSGSYHASFGRHGLLPDEVPFRPPELSFMKLVKIASQISSGMAYLAERRFVHRDLATRNCLLDDAELVKIADFGLAHDISSSESDYYRIDGQRLLPIRWLPPEALTVGKFTVHSDIWAFGVVMWEIFTYGLQPYYGQANDEVCDRIRCLKLLSRPDGCPQRVYQLMKGCWKYDAAKRTPFSKLNEMLTAWTETIRGLFLEDAWKLMLKPTSLQLAPTLPTKKRLPRCKTDLNSS